MSNWTLFSNHGHVLVCLARNSNARLRDVAADVGITERAVQKIVRDLQDGGMISITKIGRRNGYRIHKKQTLRHRLEANCKLRDLIKLINKDQESEPKTETLVNEPRKAGSRKPGPGRNKGGTGLAPERKPASIESEKIKAKPPKEAESGEPEFTDSIQKQQGSLF